MYTEPRKFENASKTYKLGEKGSGYKPRGPVIQDFYKLRDECITKRKLFEDPDFKADNSSLFGDEETKFVAIWKRPKDISREPRLFMEGAKFTVKQGKFGNAWLLAAVANLSLIESLFYKVVPNDQSFTYKYAGIFHFRFWKYGKWIDVVVDDRLPMLKNGEPAFLHSSQKNEYWSPLLEKAYAKLRGSYKDLLSGSISEAMVDFTGCITEIYHFATPPQDLYQILFTAWERSSLISVATKHQRNVAVNTSLEDLFSEHAYNITKVMEVQTSGTNYRLVRLCNPWDNQVKWNGPWSEKSPEWLSITEEKKRRMDLTCENDGEFWMSYEDLIKHFNTLQLYHFSSESLGKGNNKNLRNWEVSVIEGKWVRGVSAGGCRNFLDTFVNNPQYILEVMDSDNGEEMLENKCTVLIALIQKPRGVSIREANSTIGFIVFRVEDFEKMTKPFDRKFFEQNNSVGHTPSFMNLKEVTCRFSVLPGIYCIVPSTFKPNVEAEFILTVFSVKKHDMKENNAVSSRGIPGKASTKMILTPKLQEIEDRVDKRIFEWFYKFCDEYGELNWLQLGKLLNTAMRNEKVCSEGFSKSVCHSMISMVNTTSFRTINLEEFKHLWDSIKHWMIVYKSFVKDKGSYLSAFQLRSGLFFAGFPVNNSTLDTLVQNYSNENGELTFEDYLMCTAKLQTLVNEMKERDPNGQGNLKFSSEEWIEKMLCM